MVRQSLFGLLAMLAMTSVDAVSTEDRVTQFYFELDTGYHQAHQASVSRLALVYRPKRSDGFETSLAVDYSDQVEFEHRPFLPAEKLSHLRLGAGYRWQWSRLSLTQEFGLAAVVNELPDYEVHSGDHQIFTSLAAGYELNRNVEFYSAVNYDFGNHVFDPSPAFSLGIRFNFGRSRPAMLHQPSFDMSAPLSANELSEAERKRQLRQKLAIGLEPIKVHSVLSAAKPQASVEQEFDERVLSHQLPKTFTKEVNHKGFYSVQIGSFLNPDSIRPFLLKWGFKPEELIYREVDGLTKVSFGRYENIEQAQLIQEQLSDIGLDCFVVRL